MAAGWTRGGAPGANPAPVEARAGHRLERVPVETLPRHPERVESVGDALELGLRDVLGSDVDPTPVAPLASDLVLLHELAQPCGPGREQPVVLPRRLHIPHAAVAVMVEHETRVPPGGAVADPGRLHQGHGRVRTQFAEASRGRAAAGSGPDDRELDRHPAFHPARGRRGGQRLVPAVAGPVVGELAGPEPHDVQRGASAKGMIAERGAPAREWRGR